MKTLFISENISVTLTKLTVKKDAAIISVIKPWCICIVIRLTNDNLSEDTCGVPSNPDRLRINDSLSNCRSASEQKSSLRQMPEKPKDHGCNSPETKTSTPNGIVDINHTVAVL